MIEVVTMAYNEEKLLPFFLKHYEFADTIHMIIDEDTTDNSREICRQFSNVKMHSMKFPDMMDDFLKVDKINEVVSKCQDLILVPDVDEFIFADADKPLKDFFDTYDLDIIYVNFWQVYRNRVEKDLDPSLPAVPQRRYGDPNQGWCYEFNHKKPIVAKRKYNPQWNAGNHEVGIISQWDEMRFTTIPGAHWIMADLDIAIERRIKGRKERQSKANYKAGITSHHWNVTEGLLRAECEAMLDAPKLF